MRAVVARDKIQVIALCGIQRRLDRSLPWIGNRSRREPRERISVERRWGPHRGCRRFTLSLETILSGGVRLKRHSEPDAVVKDARNQLALARNLRLLLDDRRHRYQLARGQPQLEHPLLGLRG